MHKVIGIDVGGSGIKMAQVDVDTGRLLSDRMRIDTPSQWAPEKMADRMAQMILDQGWDGSVGIGFPTPIRRGRCDFHSNLHKGWEGIELQSFFEKKLDRSVRVANDVDVAALAETRFGNIPQSAELVVFLAFGTGIGSAIIHQGRLIEGTELGHAKWKKGIVEDYASNRARKENQLSWKKWGKRVNRVLAHYDFILGADCYILGGGVSKKFDQFQKYLTLNKDIRPAQLRNHAGVVGAGLVGGGEK